MIWLYMNDMILEWMIWYSVNDTILDWMIWYSMNDMILVESPRFKRLSYDIYNIEWVWHEIKILFCLLCWITKLTNQNKRGEAKISVTMRQNAGKENKEKNTMSVTDGDTSSEKNYFCFICVESFRKTTPKRNSYNIDGVRDERTMLRNWHYFYHSRKLYICGVGISLAIHFLAGTILRGSGYVWLKPANYV